MEKSRILMAGKYGKLLKVSIAVVVGAALLGLVTAVTAIEYLSRDLPSVEQLKHYVPPESTKVLDRKGRLLAEFYKERRTDVPLKRVSDFMKKAILAAEDADFYQHEGLDYWGILRAAVKNIRPGSAKQGASTITQQLIKIVLLSPERTYERKLKEAILARRLEQNLTKDEILELYLNQIYFGHGRYGVEEASRFFFGIHASELSASQAAMLAALPKNPMGYSPLRHRDRCTRRWRWVVSEMKDKGFITPEQAESLVFPEIIEPNERTGDPSGYYAEEVRRFLEDKFGTKTVLTGGLQVRTGADLRLQALAYKALRKGLEAVDRRYGYRGPLAEFGKDWARASARLTAALGERLDGLGLHVTSPIHGIKNDPPQKILDAVLDATVPQKLQPDRTFVGIVTKVDESKKGGIATVHLGGGTAMLDIQGVSWAKKKRGARRPRRVSDVLSVGDLVQVKLGSRAEDGSFRAELYQYPSVQGALVAIDPATRDVLALVGGYDFQASSFNRATQAKRQVGSAIKPLIYGAAITFGGYTPATMVNDSPEVYKNLLRGSSWKPKNYDKKFRGPMRLRQALTHSVNMVSIKLLRDIGIKRFIKFARNMGVKSELPGNLALALGAADVTLLEMTDAYATIAAGGKWVPVKMVESVTDRAGKTLWRPPPVTERRPMSQAAAFVLTSMMESVIKEGTGRRALALERPAAGKTGTSNDSRNAWFIGFTPSLVAGVWVGRDDNKPMYGEFGGSAACPIWTDFMKNALKGETIEGFAQPPGVVVVKIDPRTGLLARQDDDNALEEVFVEGSEPKEVSSGNPMAPPGDSSIEFMIKDMEHDSKSTPRNEQSLGTTGNGP